MEPSFLFNLSAYIIENMFAILTKYCAPVTIFFAFSVLKALFCIYYNENIYIIVGRFLASLIWCYVLNYFCTHGYTSISWACIVLPVFMRFLAF